ncbi:unnamed protein product [Musa acuminata subsp. malaccensis]|uniref:(wild Malaysian banana) hypothetical protein n=1 Tax=Musa acuminata subsp. malaccensis TaxID=214687 RepID=A0A804KAD7_MUSAM|nr:unnamed protein product [Musa acuminata subsp. malaccensis]
MAVRAPICYVMLSTIGYLEIIDLLIPKWKKLSTCLMYMK